MREVGPVGVITHLVRPTAEETADLAVAAEEAGADWVLLPDALGWRDVWICLSLAARRTTRIALGPGVTNPYTRHPYVTLAAIATLDEVSGGRAILGVAAGGSELPAYAGIDRTDAPERLRDLVAGLRSSARGKPPLPLAPAVRNVPVIGGARGRRMVEAVGDVCDVALLWAQTHEELERSAAVVRDRRAAIAWAPLRASDGEAVRAALVYGVLNARAPVRRALGVDEELEVRLRRRLESAGMDAAAELVPEAAVEAFTVGDAPDHATTVARRLGATVLAVQAYDIEGVGARVAWARSVHALLEGEG